MKITESMLRKMIREVLAEAEPDQIICPNCGHENSSDVENCSKCGHPRSKGEWKKV